MVNRLTSNTLKVIIFNLLKVVLAVSSIGLYSKTADAAMPSISDIPKGISSVGGGVAAAIIITAFLFLIRASVHNNLMYGSSYARELAKKEGFGKQINWLMNGAWRAGARGVKIGRGLAGRFRGWKWSERVKSERKGDQMLKDLAGEEARTAAMESLEFSAAVNVGELMAAVEEVADSITEVYQKIGTQEGYLGHKEEVMDKLLRDINGTNLSRINLAVAGYLKDLSTEFVQKCNEREAQKGFAQMHELFKKIDRAIDVLSESGSHIDKLRKKVAHITPRDRRKVKRELQDLRKSLNAKKAELRKASKKSPANLREAVNAEYSILQKAMAEFDKSTKATLEAIDLLNNELHEIKVIDSQVKSLAKSISGMKKEFEKFEKRGHDAPLHLSEGLKRFEKELPLIYSSDDPYVIAIAVVTAIQNLTKENSRILGFDNSFRKKVLRMIDDSFEVCRRAGALALLTESMADIDLALNRGEEEAKRIARSICSNSAEEGDLAELETLIKEQEALLKGMKDIGNNMVTFNQEIGRRLIKAKSEFTDLGKEEAAYYYFFNNVIHETAIIVAKMAEQRIGMFGRTLRPAMHNRVQILERINASAREASAASRN